MIYSESALFKGSVKHFVFSPLDQDNFSVEKIENARIQDDQVQ